MTARSNIVLIGMPGSGKSTLGRRLSAHFAKAYIDTDDLIEQAENQPIQQVVNRRGAQYLTKIESEILRELDLADHVIATGGSAVYGADAMTHLGMTGVRVYLRISLSTLVRRVNNTRSRGLAKLPQHPLPRLYRERLELYESAADVVFDNDWPISALRIAPLLEQLEQAQI